MVNGVDVGTGDNLNHVLQHFFNANKPLIIGFAEVKEVDKKNEIISQQAKEELILMSNMSYCILMSNIPTKLLDYINVLIQSKCVLMSNTTLIIFKLYITV